MVYIQFHYLFPKPDTTISNWKSSRLNLSVPLGIQHNKFFCFFSTAVQIITPGTQTLIPSARQDSLRYLPGGNELIVSSQLADTTRNSSQLADTTRNSSQLADTTRNSSQLADTTRNSSQLADTTRNSSQLADTTRNSSPKARPPPYRKFHDHTQTHHTR